MRLNHILNPQRYIERKLTKTITQMIKNLLCQEQTLLRISRSVSSPIVQALLLYRVGINYNELSSAAPTPQFATWKYFPAMAT